MDLRGRVALVTGAAGRVGRCIAETLAELGAAIAVLDKDEEPSALVASEIGSTFGVPTLGLSVDLVDELRVREAPRNVTAQLGRLDILVNCAAMVGTADLQGWAAPFPEQQSAPWRQALETNLTAPFLLTQASAEALSASGNGAVVNISSIYGLVGPDMRLYEGTRMGNPAAYAASKGGLIQITRWLATALAPRVRVNAISLGGIERNQEEAFRDRYAERTPLRRMATEADVKGAAAYLATDLSRYVTGHNLIVDGGWTAW
jgi:NAD(P)-dependent dehydrogenase (short-subunit alcohol dehydrogenase family)